MELSDERDIYGRSVDKTLNYLEECTKSLTERKNQKNKTEITKRNEKLIRSFTTSLLAKGGVRSVRVVKYMQTLARIAMYLEKDLDKATEKDIERMIAKINSNSALSDWTKRDYKQITKIYYRWIVKHTWKGEFPNIVKNIDNSERNLNNKRVLSRSMLPQEDEIQKLIDAATNVRDKALIAVIAETGLRITEALTMKLGGIKYEDPLVWVSVIKSKTETRDVPIYASKPYLDAWIASHPFKDKPAAERLNAPLWLVLKNGKTRGGQMSYGAAYYGLQKIIENSKVEKKIWFHLLRHGRATILSTKLPTALMEKMFGWKHGSDMTGTYVKLSNDDVKTAVLGMYGLKDTEKDKTNTCKLCNYDKNPLNIAECMKCHAPLNIAAVIMKSEEQKFIDEMQNAFFQTSTGIKALDKMKMFFKEKMKVEVK